MHIGFPTTSATSCSERGVSVQAETGPAKLGVEGPRPLLFTGTDFLQNPGPFSNGKGGAGNPVNWRARKRYTGGSWMLGPGIPATELGGGR